MSEDDHNAKGAALAAFGLAHGLLASLTAKGVFSLAERDELLEGILTGFEKLYPPNDPTSRAARQMIEALLNAPQRGL